jgi:hypothetical protein
MRSYYSLVLHAKGKIEAEIGGASSSAIPLSLAACAAEKKAAVPAVLHVFAVVFEQVRRLIEWPQQRQIIAIPASKFQLVLWC